MNLRAFLLTRETREKRDGLEFELWLSSEHGPVRAVFTRQEAVCFIQRECAQPTTSRRQPVALKSLDHKPVDALYYPSRTALQTDAKRLLELAVPLFETEIAPVDRFLMERFIRGGVELRARSTQQREKFIEVIDPEIVPSDYEPQLRVVSFDIETEGLEGQLYSIAVAARDASAAFIVSPEPVNGAEAYPHERALLNRFFAWLHEYDPDVLIGWNVVDFDFSFLAKKCRALNVPLRMGRAQAAGRFIPAQTNAQIGIARVPGRVVLDGIAVLRAATIQFDRYSLEHVAREVLGRGKLVAEGENRLAEIRRLYAEDQAQLAAYNLEDCRLVLEIFDRLKLIEFAIERTRLTGLALDRQGGSVAAFDFRYLPLLHRAGYVARDVGYGPGGLLSAGGGGSPGGYVMDSQPGLYDNVLVLDFKSLYPSIIRTFLIDPLGLTLGGEGGVPGFEGAVFSREVNLLPGLIAELHEARERAKREKNPALSQAIKIMMNSFYGVLGTPGCRFYDQRLASSVTRRGHEILARTRDFIEQRGVPVIYGDTDSVFVLLGPGYHDAGCSEFGTALARDLNAWWRENLARELGLESHLEIVFETHYRKFLMPTIRGSELGTKKRYAGFVRRANGEHRVVVRGLEAVRTDWTPLARGFQLELFRRVFEGEPWEEYVRQIAAEVLAGEHDAELTYRKRVRRPLEEYRNPGPPHVQAARKLGNPGRWISYAITLNGPEPSASRQSPLDYAHYLDRQLAPAADTILSFLGTSFEALTAKQMELFPESG